MQQIKHLKLKAPNLKIDLGNVYEMIRKLECVTGCRINVEEYIGSFETVEDIIAVLTDPDGYNLYPCDAPSAQKFLVAIALMDEVCSWNVVKDTGVPDTVCLKFYEGLGSFVASNDARAFLVLDSDYPD